MGVSACVSIFISVCLYFSVCVYLTVYLAFCFFHDLCVCARVCYICMPLSAFVRMHTVSVLSRLCEPVCVWPLKCAEGVVCLCASVSLSAMTARQRGKGGRSGRGDGEEDG